MIRSLFVRLAALGFLLFTSNALTAHEYTLGTLTIGHPWARATPAGAKVAGAFLSVENKSDKPDRLIQVSIEGAQTTEIHQMLVEDGVMKMRPLAGGLDVPAGTPPTLAWIGVALLAIVWISTAALQVPAHTRLLTGLDGSVVRRLVASNWIRTIAWSARAIVAIAMLALAMRHES